MLREVRRACALAWGFLSVHGALVAGQSAPLMPQRFAQYCEGESCHFGCRVRARQPISLLNTDERNAPVSGRLSPGDTALVATGSLWLRRPGIIVLVRDTVLATDDGEPRADTLKLVRGDTIYLLAYGELGNWSWWFRGRYGYGAEFWNGPAQRYTGKGRESLPAMSMGEPVREPWLRLEGKNGQSGWWPAQEGYLERLPQESFYCSVP